MHIKPNDGILVRDPTTLRIVPPEGITVSEHDSYWVRVVNDGDFTVVEDDGLKADAVAQSDAASNEGDSA